MRRDHLCWISMGNQIMAERHLHFWTFMGLLANLEESNYSRVIEARQKKPGPKASREERKRISEAHEVFDLNRRHGIRDQDLRSILTNCCKGR